LARYAVWLTALVLGLQRGLALCFTRTRTQDGVGYAAGTSTTTKDHLTQILIEKNKPGAATPGFVIPERNSNE